MPVPKHAGADTCPVTPDSLGGYRLLRTLGVGPRAEVFLAHPVRQDADPAPVVIKVYGEAVSDESAIAEIEALARSAGDHVVRLLDVTESAAGAPALILERCAGGSLARLLGERPRLEAGEAITLLAPLASALGRMHAAGAAHGAVGPGAVLFDAAGSPTLACFGRAALFEPGLPVAGLEVEQAVLSDVLAFAELAAGVLEGAGARALAHRARTEAAPGAWLASFAESLFDLAEPLPVDLSPRHEPQSTLLPARVIAALPVAEEEPSGVSPLRGWLVRARESLARVRRPVWAVAGASLVALVVAAFVTPQPGEPATALPSASPTAAAVSPVDGPVTGDDPVAAALVLLETREVCIRDLSVACFGDVDQRDSGALEADREIVLAILGGGESGALPVVDPDAVVLVQRLGDSALVSLGPNSEPASVLLVKGEAGWRIRDYLTG